MSKELTEYHLNQWSYEELPDPEIAAKIQPYLKPWISSKSRNR